MIWLNPRAAIRMRRWPLLSLAAGMVLAVRAATAQIVQGPDWTVGYNLPSQTSKAALPGEYTIRDLLTAQLNRLRRGHRADLATFTFSGQNPKTGAAAPILKAISKALDRGAAVHFVADRGINRTNQFLWGLSLAGLAERETQPLELTIAPRTTLMHHKIALFDFGHEEQWSWVASGNFTGAASMNQWNIAVGLRNPDLFNAYAFEMAEFRAGRFGPHKRRDHDQTLFRIEGGWDDSWVRFGPFPAAPGSPPNAEQEIIRLLTAAQEEIVFAMHRFNRPLLRQALVRAADRGVRVVGVIPESDRGQAVGAISGKTVKYFANPNVYAGTNRVQLLPARASALVPDDDAGQPDLVHLKYALIDPQTPTPTVIHGASNWTAAGLSAPDGNDESILFLRHAGIAQAFLEQFRRMTGQEPAGAEPGEAVPPAPGPDSAPAQPAA
jgi:hypothetical protein